MTAFVTPFLESFASAGLSVQLCILVGLVVVVRTAKEILESIYVYFLRPAKDLKKLGEWALVTGATDGIGKAYVYALAKRGISVVMVSRTESKLQALKEEMEEKKYDGVSFKYVVVDYSNFDETVRNHLYNETKDLDIGVLVNNVGMSYRYPRYFHELKSEEVDQLTELNISSTTWMTKLYV
ncbi:oxooacyl-coA reductase let-767 (Partial), partial [Seminavis robusta]|eukprot:Sro3098_g343670.1 oxooacyl-coA reductase let-767 (181) ;mRNA; r:2-700